MLLSIDHKVCSTSHTLSLCHAIFAYVRRCFACISMRMKNMSESGSCLPLFHTSSKSTRLVECWLIGQEGYPLQADQFCLVITTSPIMLPSANYFIAAEPHAARSLRVGVLISLTESDSSTCLIEYIITLAALRINTARGVYAFTHTSLLLYDQILRHSSRLPSRLYTHYGVHR